MRHLLLTTCLTLALMLAALPPAAFAASRTPLKSVDGTGPLAGKRSDDLIHPLAKEQRSLRQSALEEKLKGKAIGKVHEVAKGQYVELAREGEDRIWTVLGEFSDFPHNHIALPDPSVDNSTIWVADFNREHYLSWLFAETPDAMSVRTYYLEQSSNRYTVSGDVTEWVPVPGTAAEYDDDLGIEAVWQFLNDSVSGWYNLQLGAGNSPAAINAYLSQFDVWDRYDYDGDGNFAEPDGYIDHFQALHSGEGAEVGGGALGAVAIYSHVFYARFNLLGVAGPDFNRLGGIQIGDSAYWIGDYIIEPENCAVGEFAHEFAHDLGLPDLYDYFAFVDENAVGFWSLMANGMWLSDGVTGPGSRPGHMGAWEKFQLGWLNYAVAYAGQYSEHKLGPAETTTKQTQGLFVILPDKLVTFDLGPAYAGQYFYYSGKGDNLDNWMYKAVTLSPGSMLTAMVRYDIERDWDYTYLVVSTDGGATWLTVPTNVSTTDNPNGQNLGHGITGSSDGTWVPLTADLSAFAGSVLLGFRYQTDWVVNGLGFMVDNLELNGYSTDGAESDASWTFAGFAVSAGSETSAYFNAYVAEYRQYRGFDTSLRVGPSNFGFPYGTAYPYLVEYFPYQDGLLINYWDTSQSDNYTSLHPGAGFLLPIDAHPELLYSGLELPGVGYLPYIPSIQLYDGTFGLEPTDPITLHCGWYTTMFWSWILGVPPPTTLGIPSSHPSLPAIPVFNDTNEYWRADSPWGVMGVVNPHTGTVIEVRSVSAQGDFMQVQVRPVKGSPSRGLNVGEDAGEQARIFLPTLMH